MEKKAVEEIVGATGAPGTPQSLPCSLGPGSFSPPPPPHVQLRTCRGSGSAEGHMTCPQQLARAFRLHATGPGKGTRGCNRSFYLQPLRLAVWALRRVQGQHHPGQGDTLGQPSSQPVCSRPSGSQQSRSGRLGWRRRQDWPGSQHRTDLFPQFIWLPPHTPKQYGPASRRREVGNKSPPKQL